MLTTASLEYIQIAIGWDLKAYVNADTYTYSAKSYAIRNAFVLKASSVFKNPKVNKVCKSHILIMRAKISRHLKAPS